MKEKPKVVKEKNNKKKYILIGIGVLIVLLIGLSLAYWMLTEEQEEDNVLGTGCFNMTFTDGDAINLTNTFPMTEVEGMNTSPYEFTITNTCSQYLGYQVNIEVMPVSDQLSSEYIRVALDNGSSTIINALPEVETTITGAEDAYKLKTGGLAYEESVTYNIRKWVDENTPLNNDTQNKNFKTKISIIATPEKEQYSIKYISSDTVEDFPWEYFLQKNSDAGYFAEEVDYDLEIIELVSYDGNNNEVWRKNICTRDSDVPFDYTEGVSSIWSYDVNITNDESDNIYILYRDDYGNSVLVKRDSQGELIFAEDVDLPLYAVDAIAASGDKIIMSKSDGYGDAATTVFYVFSQNGEYLNLTKEYSNTNLKAMYAINGGYYVVNRYGQGSVEKLSTSLETEWNYDIEADMDKTNNYFTYFIDGNNVIISGSYEENDSVVDYIRVLNSQGNVVKNINDTINNSAGVIYKLTDGNYLMLDTILVNNEIVEKFVICDSNFNILWTSEEIVDDYFSIVVAGKKIVLYNMAG